MREFLLETLEYDIDVANTLRDRLRDAEGVGVKAISRQRAKAAVRDEEGIETLCMALWRLMLKDRTYMERKKEIEIYPIDDDEKRLALKRGIAVLKGIRGRTALYARAAARLMDYLSTESALNIEGFFRFRMSEAVELIKIVALKAAIEQLVIREFAGAGKNCDEGGNIIIIIRTDNDTDGP